MSRETRVNHVNIAIESKMLFWFDFCLFDGYFIAKFNKEKRPWLKNEIIFNPQCDCWCNQRHWIEGLNVPGANSQINLFIYAYNNIEFCAIPLCLN